MYDGWVVVSTTSFIQAAELTKGMLEENNIPCIILNQQDSMYPQIGEVQLLVEPENVIKAKHLISAGQEKE